MLFHHLLLKKYKEKIQPQHEKGEISSLEAAKAHESKENHEAAKFQYIEATFII